MEERRERKRKLVGLVVSGPRDKTIVVKVERRFKHKLYNKFIRSTKKYHAHDAQNRARVGETVTILESRPISKKKKWVLHPSASS